MRQKTTKHLKKLVAIALSFCFTFAGTANAQESNVSNSEATDNYATATDAIYDTENIIEDDLLDNIDELLDEDIESCYINASGEYANYMNSSYPDDMPKAVIVVPASAPRDAQYAATLIQKYIAAEDGYTPSIITDATTQGAKGFEISIGNTNRPHKAAKYTSSESYSIQSYSGGISITGIDELGLLHGAMRFLEACGGYFYMSWDDLYVTNQTHFKYDATNSISIDYERPFAFTDIDIAYWALNPKYDPTDPNRSKVGTNGYVPPYSGRLFTLAFGYNGFYADSYGLPSNQAGYKDLYLSAVDGTYTEPEEVAGFVSGQAHTLLAEYVPASKYYASHPEWYCANQLSECLGHTGYKADSKKTRSKTQLCYYRAANDPELYNIILQHCYDILEQHYDPNAAMQIISLSKNDGPDICYCDLCINNRISHNDPTDGGNDAYELLELCNKISKDLHKNGAYDNVYIDTLAYTHSLYAPVGMTADDHVIIRWAAINRCYGHTLDASKSSCLRNVDYYPELQKWLKIAKHVWIWDYNTNFRTTIGPYANVNVMQSDIKLYKALGVEGIYLQSNDRHLDTNTEFGDIRNYILGRMLQDPTRNYATELAFYTDAYYGESGKYVREYMALMEKQSANHHMSAYYRDHLANYDSYLFDVYADEGSYSDHAHRMSDADIATCEALWTKINTIAAKEPAAVQARLTRLEVSWRLVKSTLMVYEFSNPATYKAQNEKLIADIKATGTTKFSIIGAYSMDQCIYTSRKPDLWVYKPKSLSSVSLNANLNNFAIKTSMTESAVSALLQQEGTVLSNTSTDYLIDYANCGLSYKSGSTFVNVSTSSSNINANRTYYARVVLSVAGSNYDWANKSTSAPSLSINVNNETLVGATLTYDSTTNEYSIYVPCEVTVDTHTHVYDQEIISSATKISEATCTQGGLYYKSCKCGVSLGNTTATFTTAPLGHNMVATPAKDATATEAGNYAYWTCEREPGIYFKNADGTEKYLNIDATIIAPTGYEDGWLAIDNQWVYYENGERVTGWLKEGNYWYFMDENGIMQTGWLRNANKWYFLNASGKMQTGWLLYKNDWYYLNASGSMATGWLRLNDKWYYFNSSGVMQTGWLLYKNDWYYLNTNGSMQTGWQRINSVWYYFRDGVMVTGTQIINGKTYKFDSNGKWIG